MAEQTLTRGIPASGKLSFTALRNGSKLGSHEIRFTSRNDALSVEIAIDYAVKFGFVTVFRYSLRGREEWEAGVLRSAQADTNHNGKKEFMRAQREGAALMVEGSAAPRYQAPDGALIGTHWNQAQLAGPMVNPQDGELMTFTVTSRGPATVKDSAGKPRTAERFALTGKGPFDLWYDTHGIWTSLQATVRDGSIVAYMPNG